MWRLIETNTMDQLSNLDAEAKALYFVLATDPEFWSLGLCRFDPELVASRLWPTTTPESPHRLRELVELLEAAGVIICDDGWYLICSYLEGTPQLNPRRSAKHLTAAVKRTLAMPKNALCGHVLKRLSESPRWCDLDTLSREAATQRILECPGLVPVEPLPAAPEVSRATAGPPPATGEQTAAPEPEAPRKPNEHGDPVPVSKNTEPATLLPFPEPEPTGYDSIEIPCQCGKIWKPAPDWIARQEKIFPTVDIPAVLTTMLEKITSGAKDRYTSRGMNKAAAQWISNAKEWGRHTKQEQRTRRKNSVYDVS